MEGAQAHGLGAGTQRLNRRSAGQVQHVVVSDPLISLNVLNVPNIEHVVPSMCDRDIIDCFDEGELKRWQIRTRKLFTISNKCNPSVSDTMSHTSLIVPFVRKDCGGHHAWLEPPHNKLWHVLSHYNLCKKKHPEITSACALVPKWQGGSA